ncbi:MAG: DNA gyrase subunit A, partial [Sulfurospirillum sp.]
SHRKTVIIRRTIYELEKAKARAHILEGLKIALDNIDEVIKVIRASKDTPEAKEALVARFGLSLVQASAILDMKLQRLTGLERDKIENELAELMKEIDRLSAILKSEDLLNELIKEELIEIKQKFSTPRLTEIVEDYDDIDIEDLIPNEPMVVTITHRGYIKRVPLKMYEKQRRGGKGKTALTTYEDDFIEDFFTAHTHDTLMFVTNFGQLYWLKVYRIPEGSRTAKGKAVVNLINLQPEEKIKAIIPTTDFDEKRSLAFFTKNGLVKRTSLAEFKNIRSSGVRAITLNENDELVTSKIIEEDDKFIFIVTKKGMCIRFPYHEIREMGRSAKGVTGIKFKNEGDIVVGAVMIKDENQEILALSEKGIGKRTEVAEYREQKRGGKGVICMKLTSKTKDLVGVVIVDESKDLMVLTNSGKMIRVDMQQIRKAGRNTSGVIVVRVEGNDYVVSMASCPKEEKQEEEEEESL